MTTASKYPDAPDDAERVLILAPNGSYRTTPYINAAQRCGAAVTLASQGLQAVSTPQVTGIAVDFSRPDTVVAEILREYSLRPFKVVLPTDDATTEIAALAAQALGLAHNDPHAVRLTRRKDLARECLRRAGMRVPDCRRIDLTQPLEPQAQGLRYPCVVKPLAMSASRGVIRANNLAEFVSACTRTGKMLHVEGGESRADEQRYLLVEDFIPGIEVAVEALLSGGVLEVLAIFDKPDPLDGPFFEETYYITPSRLPREVQDAIRSTVEQACGAYGLREGPIHAECRINEHGAWILEVAARTIGGLCGNLLRFGASGYGLEDRVLAQALGRRFEVQADDVVAQAGGVLMIPVTQGGILRRVEGVLAAQNVEFVEEVTLQVREGHELVPWPEGSSYLGFIFARAPTPQQAEAALRAAYACLTIVTAPLWRGRLV